MDVEYAKLTRSIPLPKGMSDLENAAKSKINLESLDVDDIPAIDDDVSSIKVSLLLWMRTHDKETFLKDIENEYGGASRSNDPEPEKKKPDVKHDDEDLEEGGLCWKSRNS